MGCVSSMGSRNRQGEKVKWGTISEVPSSTPSLAQGSSKYPPRSKCSFYWYPGDSGRLYKDCVTQRRSLASVSLSVQYAEDWTKSASSGRFIGASFKWLPMGQYMSTFTGGPRGVSHSPCPKELSGSERRPGADRRRMTE